MDTTIEASQSGGLPNAKPSLPPKPSFAPKPFSLQKDNTIRSFKAPKIVIKTTPTPKSETSQTKKLETKSSPTTTVATPTKKLPQPISSPETALKTDPTPKPEASQTEELETKSPLATVLSSRNEELSQPISSSETDPKTALTPTSETNKIEKSETVTPTSTKVTIPNEELSQPISSSETALKTAPTLKSETNQIEQSETENPTSVTIPAKKLPQTTSASAPRPEPASVLPKSQPEASETSEALPHIENSLGFEAAALGPATETTPTKEEPKSEPVQKEIIQTNHKPSTIAVARSEQEDGEEKQSDTPVSVSQNTEESSSNGSSTNDSFYQRGTIRKRLPKELTSKFETGGVPLPRQSFRSIPKPVTKDESNKPDCPDTQHVHTTPEPPIKESDTDAEDFTGGKSIKNRIGLLLSKPEVTTKREEPKIINRTGGVKKRIKNWASETGSEDQQVEKSPQAADGVCSQGLKPETPRVEVHAAEETPTQQLVPQATVSSSTGSQVEPPKEAPFKDKPLEDATETPAETDKPKEDDVKLQSNQSAAAAAENHLAELKKKKKKNRRTVRFGTVVADDGTPPVVLGPEPESNEDEKQEEIAEIESKEKGEDAVPVPVYRRVGIFQRKDDKTQSQETLKHQQTEEGEQPRPEIEEELKQMKDEEAREKEKAREDELERNRLEEERRETERLKEQVEKERQMELLRQKQVEEERERERVRLEEEQRKEARMREERERQKDEEERLKMEEDQRQKEEEERRKNEQRLMEMMRLRKEDEERKSRELEEQRQKELKDEEERLKMVEDQRQKEEEERLRQEELEKEKLRQELERKMQQEKEAEKERLRRDDEERKRRELERKMQQEKEEEKERLRLEDEERKRRELERKMQQKKEEDEERKRKEEVKLQMEKERAEELKKKMEEEQSRTENDKGEENLINFDAEEPPASRVSKNTESLVDVVYDDFSIGNPVLDVQFEDFSVKPRRRTFQPRRETAPISSDWRVEPLRKDNLLVSFDSKPQETQQENEPKQPETLLVPTSAPESPEVKRLLAEFGVKEEGDEEAERPVAYQPVEMKEEKEMKNGAEMESKGEEEDNKEPQVKSYVTDDEDKLIQTLLHNEQDGISEQTSGPDSPTPVPDPVPDASFDDLDNTDSQREMDLDAICENSNPLLDNSSQKSKVVLGRRLTRTRPSRSLRLASAEAARVQLNVHNDKKDNQSDSEDEPPKSKPVYSSPPSNQRVPMFPGLNPADLLIGLKKTAGGGATGAEEGSAEDRGEQETEGQNKKVAPSPPQVSGSPRAASRLAGATRVLPPAVIKDGGILKTWPRKRTTQQNGET